MYKRTRWGFAFLALLIGLCTWLLAKVDIKYGIDLQGGALLTYSLDLSRIEREPGKVAQRVKDIIAKRLNVYGLKEISVQVQGSDRLIVRLPGGDPQAVEAIKKQVQTAGNLTFRLVASRDLQSPESLKSLEDEERAYLEADRDWVQRKVAATKASVPFTEKRPEPPQYIVRWHLEKKDPNKPEEGYKQVEKLALENKHVYNEETAQWEPVGAVSGSHLSRVVQIADPETFRPAISFEFKGEGATQFGELTGPNVGRQLAIVLDDDIMQVAVIRSKITSAGQLTGNFTDEEAKGIITILRGGSLPTKPLLESESTVGSTLGHDSLVASFYSMAVAMAAVLLFMAAYYLVGGMVANIALALNVFFTVAYVACFRQDLTLPGVAGILLTVGMAVDANILIYERVREERKRGKSLQHSIGAGYDRAFWVIFDSNITTLLTAFVLFYFGTGPVKGFAITLIAGLIASFFTSIYVTRLVLSGLYNLGLLKDLKMLQLFETPRIPFVAKQRVFLTTSLAVILISWCFVVYRGERNFGIDFNGGAQIGMNLKKPLKEEEMRQKINALAAAHKDLFSDYSLQTLSAEGPGFSRSFILLTHPVKSAQAQAQEGGTPAAPREGEAPAVTREGEAPAGVPGGPAPAPLPETSAEAPAPPTEEKRERELSLTQRVRAAVEEMLAREGLLLEPAFPGSRWEPDTTATLKGSEFLVLDVNLLDVSPTLTTDDLKQRLEAWFQANPLLRASTLTEPAGGFQGISISKVELVAKPAEAQGVTTYRIQTTPYQPPIAGVTAEGKVPTKAQVEDAVRRYFTSGNAKTPDGKPLFRLAEPFSQVDTVSGSVAENLKADALVAVFISMLGIIFYVSLRFEFIYGLAAVMALLHDILISIGVAAVTDQFFSNIFPVKINLTELAAILTIIGYSINDTIVIFDRIRENLQILAKRKFTLPEIVDMSVNQTLARSIWTSLTVFMVTVVLLGFGGPPVRGFAFIFCVGIVSGSYSTIFIASPVVLWLHNRALARRQARAQEMASA